MYTYINLIHTYYVIQYVLGRMVFTFWKISRKALSVQRWAFVVRWWNTPLSSVFDVIIHFVRCGNLQCIIKRTQWRAERSWWKRARTRLLQYCMAKLPIYRYNITYTQTCVICTYIHTFIVHFLNFLIVHRRYFLDANNFSQKKICTKCVLKHKHYGCLQSNKNITPWRNIGKTFKIVMV